VQELNAPLIVVDFAHTSEALKVALQAIERALQWSLDFVFLVVAVIGIEVSAFKMMAAALQNADYVG